MSGFLCFNISLCGLTDTVSHNHESHMLGISGQINPHQEPKAFGVWLWLQKPTWQVNGLTNSRTPWLAKVLDEAAGLWNVYHINCYAGKPFWVFFRVFRSGCPLFPLHGRDLHVFSCCSSVQPHIVVLSRLLLGEVDKHLNKEEIHPECDQRHSGPLTLHQFLIIWINITFRPMSGLELYAVPNRKKALGGISSTLT